MYHFGGGPDNFGLLPLLLGVEEHLPNVGDVCPFLAVQDSSIGDLVTHSLTHSLSERLLISATSEHYNDYSDTTVTLQ